MPEPKPQPVVLNTSAPEDAVSPRIANAGSLSLWFRLNSGFVRDDHLFFATSDSRIVLVFDTYTESGTGLRIQRLAARAVGNRKATPDSGQSAVYPEAAVLLNNSGQLDGRTRARPVPEDTWHHLTMTWDGYPEGIVRIYLNGERVASTKYDSRYDNGAALPSSYSVGYRPSRWPTTGGAFSANSPGESMSLRSGGIEASSPRLYAQALTSEQIRADLNATEPG